LILALVLTAAVAPAAPAAEFAIRPGGSNMVRFLSKAPLESVEGKTSAVTGRVVVDPEHLADSVTVQVEVDLASLDTGIDLRNQHMRDNHLETAKFPTAVFEGGRVRDATATRLLPGEKVTFNLDGQFTVHGVTRPITAAVEVVAIPDPTAEAAQSAALPAIGELKVTARFEVKLSDHQITRPQFLVMRLDEVQRITVELRAMPPGR